MLSKPAIENKDLPLELGSLKQIQKGNGSRIFVLTKTDLQKTFACQFVDIEHPTGKQDLENEFQILSNLNSEHIVRVFGQLKQNYEYQNKQYSVMIMENAKKSTLLEVFNFFKIPPTSVTRTFFQSVATGLKYIHNLAIAHLDLKLENVLVFDDFNPKIADFGLSATKDCNALTKYVGTQVYMPPEIIQIKRDYNRGKNIVAYNGFKADIFSFGVMLSIFIFGTPIFKNADENDSNFKLAMEGRWEEIWDQIKFKSRLDSIELENSGLVEELKDLFQNILNANANERIDIIQVLEHPWFFGEETNPNVYYRGRISQMRREREESAPKKSNL